MLRVFQGLVRLSGDAVLRTRCASVSTSARLLAGSKWRLEQGLGKCGNEYGPLVDIPDWSYADGRATPLAPREIRRREKQKELAGRAVQLISELQFAKKNYASRPNTEILPKNDENSRPIKHQRK